MKWFLNTYRIKGQKGYDPKNFFDNSEPRVLGLLTEKKKPIKTHFLFNIGFARMDPETGEGEKMTRYFHSEVEEIYEATSIAEKYREMRNLILEKVATFQPEKSAWQFDQINSLDISIVPFRLLAGTSFIPTPKKIGYRKAIQNIQNRFDHKCFMYTMGAALRAALGIIDKNPQRLTKELNKLSEKSFDWTGIEFPHL